MTNTESVHSKKEIVKAVVVTYNRFTLLQRVIACLKAQTHALDGIIVIDNASTDGTADWLDQEAAESGLTVIHQENVGGSGGFWRGISEARTGADWIWCMDDDVFPRPDCLQRLLAHAQDEGTGLLAPRRLMGGKVYTNDFTAYDLRHPFRSLRQGRLKGRDISTPTEIAGTAFEGPLIRTEAVRQVGLPEKDLFIFCDDTEYCLRIHQAGFRLWYIPDALMDKQEFFTDDSWAERNRKKKWKRFYQVRNSAYLNHHYGQTFGARYLRGLLNVAGYILPALFTAPFSKAWSWHDIPRLWQAYQDGIRERLGKY